MTCNVLIGTVKLNPTHSLRDCVCDQVFKQPWPGMMRTVYGNHERFETTYFKKFPGYYTTGDGESSQPSSTNVTKGFLMHRYTYMAGGALQHR